MNITYVDVFILSIVFLISLYYIGKRKYVYFKNKGVKYLEPFFPFLGSFAKIIFQMETMSEFLERHYNAYPDQKYIGLYEMHKPMLMVRDLEIIKQVGIKDFDHFVNHRIVITEEHDSLFGNVLFALQGEKWKDMRSSLSPAFTSSKMRNMFQLVEECADSVADFYINEINKSESGIIEIDVKNEISKFNMDVIATAAYGIKINSLQNTENDFFKFGKNTSVFTGKHLFKQFSFALFPKLMKIFNVSFINPDVTTFFKDVVLNTMRYRDQHGIKRDDMISLLMEAKKGLLKHEREVHESSDAGFATVQESNLGKQDVKRKWSDDELVAQAFVFFLAGFETESTLLTFFIYEMVHHPDIQKKLQDEIDEYNSNSDGKIVYNDLHKLKYLDMCISETLRHWPPANLTDRVCTKTYKFPPPTDLSQTKFQMNVDETIWIPIYAIHHDAKYYPNPEQFDPDRFSEENKSSLNPMAFMPFGIGPRNCIGSRFALMESKLIIYHLLSKFDFVTTENTKIPITLDRAALNVNIKGGLKIGLKPRQ